MDRAKVGRRRRHGRQLPLWAIPTCYALGAVVVGLLLPRLETSLFPESRAGLSPESAVAIYSTVGSGMIALTGIVFSLAFVMLQFSATAYSPRLVLWLARAPVLWHAVGTFSATFLYAIAAIAWVSRSEGHAVPFLTGWTVIGLLLASVGMFIALIEKLSLLQVHRMLTFTADHGRRVIEETYEAIELASAPAEPADYSALPVTQTLRFTGRPRTLQAIDVPALTRLAASAGGVAVVVPAVGDTLVEGGPMLRVHGGSRPIEEAALQDAFELGADRTFEQDPKYALRLLVDIAIRALSPAVNDPTTAVQALNQVEGLLLCLGARRLDVGAVRDADGVLRLVVPCPSWDDFLSLAFDEIRAYGAGSIQVMRRMKALAADLIAALPAERAASLRDQQRRLDATIARSFEDVEDKKEASVEDRQGLGVPRTRGPSAPG